MTIDESVKDFVLRYPTVDLIRRLYPDVRMGGRSVLCNPLRGEHNASLSCYRDRFGISRWKDHATGEFGDNLDFFRLAFPQYDYPEALDRLAMLVVGRPALVEDDRHEKRPASPAPARARAARQAVRVEPEPVLKVVSDIPFFSPDTPQALLDYARGRGISDAVLARYCRCVVFENTRRSGTYRVDRESGIPIIGDDGRPMLDEARSTAVAMPNDLPGGFSLRVPQTAGNKGFKGCNRSYVTTFYGDGTSLPRRMRFFGPGEGMVERLEYNERTWSLFINPSQGFTPLPPYAVRYALPFLGTWVGRELSGRDLDAAVAVLDSLSGPVRPTVTVVEGLFDALSVIEIQARRGRGPVPGSDLLVLNSVNNFHWAVPFLSMHSEVRSLLDNDLRSGAGQRFYAQMEEAVLDYSAACGKQTRIWSDSRFFAPYKDINEYLVASGGRPPVPPGTADEKKKT